MNDSFAEGYGDVVKFAVSGVCVCMCVSMSNLGEVVVVFQFSPSHFARRVAE